MIHLLPVMRINYKFHHLLEAFFISECSEKYSNRLKKELCSYFGCNNILLTSSGRTAIYLIVKHLPQTKVVIPAYTCEVVKDAVELAGKEIIYAHVNKDTLNISEYPPIDSDTIVIATHQYGLASEMEQISAICKKQHAILVEDCAGSFGTKTGGRLTGTYGDFAVFSFSASKTFHSPTKGGFILAKKPEILKGIEKELFFRVDGFSFKVKQLVKGIGFCLNNNPLFCAILQTLRKSSGMADADNSVDSTYQRPFYEWQAFVVYKQLKKRAEIFEGRKRVSKLYNEFIVNKTVQKPVYDEDVVNIRYAILVQNRDEVARKCVQNGIQVGKGYKKSICPETYTEEKDISNQILYLPIGNNYSDKEIFQVIDVINAI